MATRGGTAVAARVRRLRDALAREKGRSAALTRSRAEALEQQAAAAEILKVISRSPSDAQPVFDAIVRRALRLMRGHSALVTRIVDGIIHLGAFTSTSKTGDAVIQKSYPRPVDRASAAGRAIRSRRPAFVRDTEKFSISERAKAVARTRGYRSILAVPMLRDGVVIGSLNVTRKEPGPFSKQEIDLLQTFAQQAVIAIENVRRFNETKEALERQTATAEILKVIASSPADVQPVFDAIVQSSRHLLGGKAGTLVRVVDDQLHLAAFTTLDDAEDAALRALYPIPAARGVSGEALRTLSPVYVSDTETDPGVHPTARETTRVRGVRSMVVAPLVRDRVAIGLIMIARAQPGAFTGHHLDLLKTFADQAVIAIENVRLFNETKEALEQQTAISEVLRVISSSPADVQPVLEAVAVRAAKICDASDARIALVEGDQIRHVAGFGDLPPTRECIPLERGAPIGRAVIDRATVYIPDIQAETSDDFALAREIAAKSGWRSNLVVPLMRKDGAVGAIALRRRDVRPFTPKQISLLQTFADQAAIAIENVRLFNETKEALEHQKASADILRVISGSPTDLHPVMAALAESAARLCEATDAHIWQREGDELQAVASHGGLPLSRWRLRIGRDSVVGRAAHDCKRVHVHDLAAVYESEFPDSRAMMEGGYRTVLAAPLVREGSSIGAILIRRTEVRPFTSKQLALLQTFADQAVIAIENVRLFKELEARNRQVTEALEQQTATAEILKVISSSPTDTQPVFDTIASNAERLCESDNVAVFRVEGNMLRMVAESGAAAKGRSVGDTIQLTRTSLSGRAVLESRTIHIHDLSAEPDAEWQEAKAVQRVIGFRTALAVPLVREGAAIGVIFTRRMEVRPFSDKQVALLKTFADQAVIAIENVRLFTETKEALERQTATAEILQVISSSPTDLHPVFDAILENAMRLCGAHLGFVGLCDGDRYEHLAQRGANPEFARWIARGPFVPDPRMALARALKEREPAHFPDMRDSDAYRDGVEPVVKTVDVGGARTLLAVPLLKEERAVGAIIIYRPEVRPFTQKQIDLVSMFASQAVIAIENVRLFKELEARTAALGKSVQKLTALGEVGQAISSTLELETVLKTIATHAVRLTGLDGASIYEYDEADGAFRLQAADNIAPGVLQTVRNTPIRKGDGTVGSVAITLEPIQVPDILDQGYQSTRKEMLVEAGYRAVLTVPLLREDHIIGALSVTRRTPGPFGDEIVELLKTFATQSAMAIQNARLFREIAEKGKQLEVASQHKSHFLASMSHELRTPLNALLGFNEMILGDVYGPVPADMQPPLAQMQASGKHLLRLINNVLDLAKIEAGRMELALTDYSVQDTVEAVRSTLRPLATEKGIELLASVPADVPLAYGDPGRITQCLMNLAGNSLKFTKAGKVEISVAENGKTLTYRVADTGIGIPPDKMESLFTEFKQTDATIASEYGGTGLGLSISKKFVEMHGGRIWVESTPGQGSTFSFEIPLRAGEGNSA